MNVDLMTIYSAQNAQLAELLRERLAEAGIEAFVSDALESIQYPPGHATEPKVLVRSTDAKQARSIAEQFEHRLAQDHEPAKEPYQIDDSGWPAWPLCDNCGQRRQSVCPICGLAGVDFPLADDVEPAPRLGDEEEEDGGRPREVLLLCEQCDEAFPPKFYRVCHACGHEHEAGLAVSPQIDSEDSPRTVLVFLVLALLGLGGLTYFWFILRG